MATSSVSNSSSGFDYTSLNGTSGTTTSSTTESQSRFLKLLTTQLQNQDPLNPMDNAEMTSQMAQINMVDGISKMNTTMQTLLSAMTGSQTMQAASMVNHGVLVPGSSLTLAGKTDTEAGSAVGGYQLVAGADNVKLTISDANGVVVRTVGLGEAKAGLNSFNWDGKNDAGAAVENGSYSFTVEAIQGSDKVDVTALTLGVVSSVSSGSDGLMINVAGRGSFKLSEVQQIF